MTNREIAQEISNRIGTAPVPFDSVYSIALEIYHQLGGEESQFDSVYSILLEILPLVEGGSGKAIEEVDELPEPSENKDKLLRLSSDDNVYVSELKSRTTTTTNRLPDAQQIDKAYLYLSDDGSVFYYKGIYKIICSDGELIWNRWGEISGDELVFATELSPNEGINNDTPIVCINDYGSNITETSAYFNDMSIDDIKVDGTVGNLGFIISATYNAPEANQIGNAYIDLGEMGTYPYVGTEVTTEYEGEQVIGYYWGNPNYDDFVLTIKKASDIYTNEDNLLDIAVIYVNDSDEHIAYDATEYLESIYIPQLNAPDSEQVDNAYVERSYDGENIDKFIYKGETTIHCTNGDYTAYIWQGGLTLTDFDYLKFTTYNANSVYNNNLFIALAADELYGYLSVSGTDFECTLSLSELTDIFENNSSDLIEGTLSHEISTVKYQRTEVVEDWQWEKVAVKEDIKPAIIDVESLPDEITDANKGNIYRVEGDCNYIPTPDYGTLPDNEQIDEAYIEYYTDCQGLTYYKGTFKVICTDGEIDGYGWYSEGEFNNLFITQNNAVNISDSDEYTEFSSEVLTLTIDWDTNTATVNKSTESEDIYSGVINELQDYVGITKAEGDYYAWEIIPRMFDIIYSTPVINVNADLVYNQDMTINSIDNVEYTTSTGEELSEISYAASINANLNIKVSGMQMGTVSAI